MVGGTITLNDNSADIRGLNLGATVATLSSNNVNGTLTINQRGLSKYNLANNSIAGTATISNDFTASGITVPNQRIIAFSNNIIGGTGINIYYSGSADGTYGAQRSVLSNLIQGTFISASVVGDSSKNLSSTAIIGRGLNVYGTSQQITSSIGLVDYGSAFFSIILQIESSHKMKMSQRK